MRRIDVNAPVTQEEAAFKLFNLITKNDPHFLPKEEILPLFASCLIAVKDPVNFMSNISSYNVKTKG